MLVDGVVAAAAAMPMLATSNSIAVTVTVIVPSVVLLETRINEWIEFDLGDLEKGKQQNNATRKCVSKKQGIALGLMRRRRRY